MTVPPGSTIGIIGGGQLGRMLAIAAAQLGYRCHIFDPHEHPPAADVAAALHARRLRRRGRARSVRPTRSMSRPTSSRICPVAPLACSATSSGPARARSPIAQDRAVEKQFIERMRRRASRRGARWTAWTTCAAAVAELGLPLVLKTRRYGYDGKGQAWIRSRGRARTGLGARSARSRRSPKPAVDFAAEFSVIVARWADGRHAFWDSPENEHRDGILRRSTVPVQRRRGRRKSTKRARRRCASPRRSAMSASSPSSSSPARDGPVVNEIAPRVHNSGHWTIEGAVTSQFEQHIRAICGLPPGSTDLVGGGATMDNLIGDDVEPLARAGRRARRPRPPLRQGRSAPRPQDGPRHARSALRRRRQPSEQV